MNTQNKTLIAGIVDDDATFRYGFKKLALKKGVFSRLLTFNNGIEAIDYLKDLHNSNSLPDVLFVDINMPLMDGWEFMDAFRDIHSQLSKNIVTYNISSSIDIEDIKRAKRNPLITDYLLKPIDEHYLADIARSLQNPSDKRKYN
jgi:CheY-like chemotaxis protein